MSGPWKKKRFLVPLSGVALVAAIGATSPQEPPAEVAAEPSAIEDELPRASTTIRERISSTTTSTSPSTTSTTSTTAAPTTTTPPPPPPPTTAAPTTTVRVQSFAPTTTPPPAPTSTAAPAPPPPTAPPTTAGAYYANCDEARAAGAAPIQRSEPGYRPALDRDDDGTACDT